MSANPFLGKTALRLTWMGARVAALFSTRLAGLFAARLWFTPWQIVSERALAREAAWLRDTEPLEIETSEGRMTGFTAGRGPAVLLVHGWGDRGATMGAFIAPLVAAGFRVVGLDLPAHGRSPGRQTDILKVSAALRGAAESAGGLHAVIAHSMGAAATAHAIRQGLDVSRLVFLAPAVRLEHGVAHFQRLFALPHRAAEGLRITIERRFGRTVWSDIATDNLMRDLEIPGLIIHDQDDPQVSRADVELLAESWPAARLVATEGLAHVKVARAADVVERAVDFVSAANAEQPVA